MAERGGEIDDGLLERKFPLAINVLKPSTTFLQKEEKKSAFVFYTHIHIEEILKWMMGIPNLNRVLIVLISMLRHGSQKILKRVYFYFKRI